MPEPVERDKVERPYHTTVFSESSLSLSNQAFSRQLSQWGQKQDFLANEPDELLRVAHCDSDLWCQHDKEFNSWRSFTFICCWAGIYSLFIVVFLSKAEGGGSWVFLSRKQKMYLMILLPDPSLRMVQTKLSALFLPHQLSLSLYQTDCVYFMIIMNIIL